MVALHKRRSDGVNQTRYLHRDHLGSVTEVTNETGTLLESRSYDVWGKRRNTNWTPASGQIHPAEGRRGFTGHEHLDDAALIHMNGRVYDPNVGRMLSPDPFVQFAGYSQSFNRYSYTLNNPLSFTDPSGFEVENFNRIWPLYSLEPIRPDTFVRFILWMCFAKTPLRSGRSGCVF